MTGAGAAAAAPLGGATLALPVSVGAATPGPAFWPDVPWSSEPSAGGSSRPEGPLPEFPSVAEPPDVPRPDASPAPGMVLSPPSGREFPLVAVPPPASRLAPSPDVPAAPAPLLDDGV
jgi:hypothetical protein